MATDPDLQSLIDARKKADREKVDAASAETQRQSVLAERRRLEEEAWKKLLFVINDEAGRVNSVSEETGIVIMGTGRGNGFVSQPSVGYHFTSKTDKSVIDVTFSKQDDGLVAVSIEAGRTRNVEIMNYQPQHPARPAGEVQVRAIFNEVAKVLIRA